MADSVGKSGALRCLLRPGGPDSILTFDFENGQIKATHANVPGGGTERTSEEHREAVETFARIVTAELGNTVGAEARHQLAQLPAGRPLFVRQAKIVVEQSVMRAANKASFEKLALRHVVPAFHEQARKILDEELRQNADAGTRGLKEADFALMLKAVQEKLKALQEAAISLPSRDDVEEWAGKAAGPEFAQNSYKEILAELEMACAGITDLRRLEGLLQKYCAQKRHSRLPEMQALLAQTARLRHWVESGKDLLAADGTAAPKGVPTQHIATQAQPSAVLDLDKLKKVEPIKLGSGTFNAVQLVHYTLPGEEMPRQGVFKPDNCFVYSPDATTIGIDRLTARWPQRNVATYKVSEALRLGVIPHTSLATLSEPQALGLGVIPHTSAAPLSRQKGVAKDQKGVAKDHEMAHSPLATGTVNVQKGVIMDRALGYSPLTTGTVNVPINEAQRGYLTKNPKMLEQLAKSQGFESATLAGGAIKFDPGPDKNGERESIVEVDVHDKVFQREATKLNWFDILIGQVDRHGHNFFVELDGDGKVIAVKGIDNDLAFGKNSTDPSRRVGKSTDMPRAIDTATYKALMDLSADGLRALLTGLLDHEEIEASVQRLTAIQNTLKSYPEKGWVLDDDQWGTEDAARLLGIPKDLKSMSFLDRMDAANAANYASYVARQAVIQQLPHAPVMHLDEIQQQLKQMGSPDTSQPTKDSQ